MKIVSDAYLERWAQDDRMILENPVSLIGAGKRLIPYGSAGQGWWAILTWTLTILAVLIAWVLVLAWYAVLTAIPVLWIGWAIGTLNRRHHIHDRLRAAMPQPVAHK